ncbi:hypothetical protein T01_10395 [Trichinella spiralis]|uniref:Uncharacterized protein n=1 Tax=Trichinella spiralis TaxID=6334 RepID=A0A0V1BD06_TRISP|nr:hypothetical protein T01_10395 [Trichinella spiralis]
MYWKLVGREKLRFSKVVRSPEKFDNHCIKCEEITKGVMRRFKSSTVLHSSGVETSACSYSTSGRSKRLVSYDNQIKNKKSVVLEV